jgi:hypothetical protein
MLETDRVSLSQTARDLVRWLDDHSGRGHQGGWVNSRVECQCGATFWFAGPLRGASVIGKSVDAVARAGADDSQADHAR